MIFEVALSELLIAAVAYDILFFHYRYFDLVFSRSRILLAHSIGN